jgi:hypothetical protein
MKTGMGTSVWAMAFLITGYQHVHPQTFVNLDFESAIPPLPSRQATTINIASEAPLRYL